MRPVHVMTLPMACACMVRVNAAVLCACPVQQLPVRDDLHRQPHSQGNCLHGAKRSEQPKWVQQAGIRALGLLRRKLAELEREVRRVTKQRAAYAAGREFGCCTVVFHRNVIPPAVRVWDL